MKKTFTFLRPIAIGLITLLSSGWAVGQSSPGDIAFIAANVDGGDDFAFVTLVDIPANTSIYFTDNEWNGTAFADLNEGELTWTNGSSILLAGSVVVFTDPVNTSSGSVNVGTMSGTSWNLGSSNEWFYALMSEPATSYGSTPIFLAAMGTDAGSGWLTGTGLTEGTDAIDFNNDHDGFKYTGIREGEATFAAYLPLIMNSANWQDETSDGELILPISATTFTAGADITAPVATWDPTNSATDVSITSNITITYDEAIRNIDNSEITSGAIVQGLITLKETDVSGADVAFTATIDDDKKVITITPNADLANSQLYYVAIAEVEDVLDNATTAESITFTTVSATPVLTLTTPNGGESWVAGTIHSITWSSVSYSTTVDIEYTTNGTDFTTIADNETDDGTYLWSIPNALAAGTYKIRISDDKTSITTSDLSDGDFVIKASSTIIINEVDADTEGTDALEFIELYDGGVGNSALDGLVLVLHNGSDDASYVAYDLDTYSTDANGYFVIGSSSVVNVDYDLGAITNIIQNGPDAVALYYGDDSDFPNDTPVTTTNLIDALVYDTSDSDDAGLLVLLNAAEPQVDEAGNGNSARHSNQRILNGNGGARNTSTYGQYFPTPGAENDEWQTTWTGASDTYWETSGNWSDGIPTVNHDVTIPTGKTPIIAASTSANCYDLTLAVTATLTIQSGASNSGSLIFGGTYTGSATAVTYQRYFTDAKEQMFGSPFSGQAVDGTFLSSNSINGMIHYIEASDSWSVNYTSTLPSSPYNAFAWGTGYMAKRDGSGVVNLTGTPNNASVEVTLTKGAGGYGWNLLSNPFTSAIAANATGDATNNLLTVNEGVLDASYTALYIWDGSAYKIINHVDGDPSVTLFQNYLQVGQGFFVRSSDPATGTFSITPAMQSHQTAIAFKSSEEASWASIILNAEINDAKESTKILFREDMSSGLDIGYDAGVFKSNLDFSLYSRLVKDNGVDFGLQCLPSNYNELIIPIGLGAKAGEIVKFSINALNIPEEYAVILEDRTANTFTNLSDETAEYTIQLTNDSDGTGRFFIHTSFKSALGIDDLATENAFKVFSRAKDHQLVIWGYANKNATARIYSITGKLVTVVDLRQTTENLIPFNEEAGVYIVQITNEGETQTQKFIWVK